MVIWDQYLSKNMKWDFGNMGSISFQKTFNELTHLKVILFSAEGTYTIESYERNAPTRLPPPPAYPYSRHPAFRSSENLLFLLYFLRTSNSSA